MIGLLRPNQLGTLHDVALQLLLKLAAASPAEFKSQLAVLSDYEKQQMETSVRLNYASQQQQTTQVVQNTVKAATPLKLDFSKYS